MEVRTDRKYTEEHEWVLLEEGNRLRIGITDYAQDALGDIVYVDLPDVGADFVKGDTMAEIESTKSVGEVYAPVDGSIVEVNTELDDNPEIVNMSPFDDGWIVVLEIADDAGLDDLIDATEYTALTE